MNSMEPAVDATGVPYEEVSLRGPKRGWVLDLVHLALGGITTALALSEDFARGRAAFASDGARVAFGAAGLALLFLAVRGVVRLVRGERRKLTPELRRKARLWGRILIAAGVAFFAMATVDPLAEASVSFAGWVRIFYVCMGAYLVLLGLSTQWDPTRHIRQQRVAKGEGRRGTARIVRASDTGVSMNDAPQVKIDFELEVDGRTHLVSDKIVMERAKLALLIPGATVEVLVDRVDPNVFHVHWDSWKPPAT